MRGFVPDEELVALLRHAEASVYVSVYEGYGLPPLESLALSTPVVTSPGLALETLWPDDPYRVDEIEAGTLAERLERLLGDAEERSAAVEAGRRVAASQTWERATAALLDEIEEALA